MIDTLDKLNKKFNNKYDYLQLLDVEYDSDVSQCTITLLYPYFVEDFPAQDKKEITDFYQEFLSLRGTLKVKFKRSFLDEVLIVDEIVEYFKSDKKGLLPYIQRSNISSKQEGDRVNIKLTLNQDVLALIDDFELAMSIKKHIEKNFITTAVVEIFENEEVLPEDIIANDILPQGKKARRYEVKVEKKLVGGDIMPQPEYIGDNKSPKESVILCGFISKINQKTYIQKKGKRAGQERNLYSFNLKDETGSVECVFFCGKTHQKVMDGLEDMFMLLMVGDLKIGLNDKLTYYVRKISMASPIEMQQKEEEIEVEEKYVHKKVASPEIIPKQTQGNLFEVKKEYNEFIMNNNIVVFDLETTGLNPEECEITELGAVKIDHGEIKERFWSFAKPKNPIPYEVEKLTNISNEMVANAPRIEDVVYDFYEWTRGAIISGYNIIGFDMKFLNKVADRIGITFDNEVVDTYVVAKQSSIKVGNYKLGTVVKALGLKLEDAHRAYNDAHATAEVLMEFNKIN
ncbi:MAG: ribonuclease H-like domain-containing protein [Clostridia bacterium]|nr:ribonuclease H-like domain-containing protein [Clostridia bacterium]